MPRVDNSFRVGMVAYATRQGLGYLAKSFYDAGIIDDVILVHHGSRATYPEWYDNKAVSVRRMPIRGPEIDDLLSRIDLLLCFETPFDWDLLPTCRSRKICTVLMPMYEGYPRERMGGFDFYLCPSLLDMDYFSPGAITRFFRPPVDPSTWRLRTRATRFLHNAGNIGHRWHKGTLELLQAMPYVRSNLSLMIGYQDQVEFRKLLSMVHLDPRVILAPGEVPHEELFSWGDVYVAPEKFNGLSLPLQEAYAAGLLVMTSDRYPANTWLPEEPLIPVKGYHRACISHNYLEFDEAEVDPKDIARTMDEWYDRDITGYSLQAKDWAECNSWNVGTDECLTILRGFLAKYRL